jgi:vanillate O-demethylase ferredoxin subunit
MSDSLLQSRPTSTSTPEGSFEVHLQQSALTLLVGADESVLQALERVGVHVDSCCQQGICGSCMTTVLEGEPVHMDMCLSEEDRQSNQVFMPCCSRAKGRLVLDL